MTSPSDQDPARLQREQLLALTKEALRTLSSGSIVVSDTSRSMVPLLQGGERLHWIKAESPARQGELLIYVQSPGPIVHRVMWQRADGSWRTKGDGRGGFDTQPVAHDEVLGVVVAIERDGAVLRLDRLGARTYARVAAWLSLTSGIAFVVASAADGLLRRALRRQSPVNLMQTPAWWFGRAAQEALQLFGFRICHGAWHKEKQT